MPVYTTTAQVDQLLPDTLPASITQTDKDRWVGDASALVDDEVGPRYPVLGTGQKFADMGDSPPTPPGIELCARWYAAYFGFLQLREINRAKESASQAKTYFELAKKRLADIRKGTIQVHDASGADLAGATAAYSSSEGVDLIFSRGARKDGVLQGEAGTLDDYGLS